MKKNVLLILFLIIAAGISFSQQNIFAGQNIFVSAAGNDNNDGLSEEKSFKTLEKALDVIVTAGFSRIIVIGTLETQDEWLLSVPSNAAQFPAQLPAQDRIEVTISGMRGAEGSRQAILNGGNTNLSVLNVTGNNTRIRLENIEIINSRSNEGAGIQISDSATVTLGQGAVVRNNNIGIKLSEGTCILDGGEVRDNLNCGILITQDSFLMMRGGVISNNHEGGVIVQKGGRFNMTSGSITGNYNTGGGAGVKVLSGGRFDQTSGIINNNFSPFSENVHREEGSFGNDLSAPLQRHEDAETENGDDLTPSERKTKFRIPLFLGFYGHGGQIDEEWHDNYFSAGLMFQSGVELAIQKSLALSLLAEGGFSIGYPYFIELNFLGALEVFFPRIKFGFFGGYGIRATTISFNILFFDNENYNVDTEEIFRSPFYRLGVFYHGRPKASFYINYHSRGEFAANFAKIENWRFGLQYSVDFLTRTRR